MVLILRTFDLPLLIFKPVLSDVAANPVVLPCIWSWLCERRARSSAKSKSSSCVQGFHWIPFFFPSVVVLIIQFITRRNRSTLYLVLVVIEGGLQRFRRSLRVANIIWWSDAVSAPLLTVKNARTSGKYTHGRSDFLWRGRVISSLLYGCTRVRKHCPQWPSCFVHRNLQTVLRFRSSFQAHACPWPAHTLCCQLLSLHSDLPWE